MNEIPWQGILAPLIPKFEFNSYGANVLSNRNALIIEGFKSGLANRLSLDRICYDIYTVKNISKAAMFDSS